MTRVGIFELVDPPEGIVETVTATIGAIDYPWECVQPYLDREGIDAIRSCWGAPSWMSNETTGNWNAADNTIYLSTQFTGWQDDVPFVLTHEIGHLVDRATLTDRQRTRLMAVMHDHPDFSAGPYGHDSEVMHHSEYWLNGGCEYSAKVYECWADLFVATFAPTVWDGSVTDAAPQHWPRFVHWTDDLEAVRRIVLAVAPPEPAPPPPPPEPPPTQRRERRRRRRRHHRRRLCGWFHRR